MNPRSRLAIAAFCLYIPVLFTGTHWPKLQIEGPVERPDLIVHLAAFGLWSTLCALCAWWGPVASRRNLLITWIVGVSYAAIDEGLQAIPALQRTCAWDDYAANVGGITLGVSTVLLIARIRARIAPRW